MYGNNGTGKTTLADAFQWLLFGKDSQGKADFEIKPLDANNQPIHNLETSVAGTFEIDGKTVTLRKVFSEKWTRKRGQATPEFTGHTTDHFLNDVPVQKKEYDAAVAEFAREDVFRLLTNPAYFNENMRWQDRRQTLLEVSGNLADDEVISTYESLAGLPAILQGRSLDDHRKVLAAKRTEINKELERVPVRISEVQQGLPELPGMTRDQIDAENVRLIAERTAKQAELARIQNGGEVAEKTKVLREIESDLLTLENEFRRQMQEQAASRNPDIIKLQNAIAELRPKTVPVLFVTADTERRIKELREKWAVVNARQMAGFTATCPACGQALPEEKVKETHDNFYRQKSEELESITEQGKALGAELEKQKARNAELQKQAEEAGVEIARLETAKTALQNEAASLLSKTPSGPEIEAKQQEIAALKSSIETLRNGGSETISTLAGEIDALSRENDTLLKAEAAIEQRERGLARIDELQKSEKTLATEFERLEGELFLTEEFIRAKVSMLESRINSRFKLARFKLFEQQINGGLAECCETLYKGIPYGSGLNSAAQINVGLDIINTLAEHYSFAPPIMVDKAESVTDLIPAKGQMIRLVVSKPDTKLRVEAE